VCYYVPFKSDVSDSGVRDGYVSVDSAAHTNQGLTLTCSTASY